MTRTSFVMWTLLAFVLSGVSAVAGTRTWDGKFDTSKIAVTVVYFVPADRDPLPDWTDRVRYYCRRIEQFHQREFGDQSVLQTLPAEVPLTSELTTSELRRGDANAIFFRTLQEAERRLNFAAGERNGFPILLVLSDINWKPLDDFYRVKPVDEGFAFEGQNIGGHHFPGAESGGARATYLSDRGVGWGLVSADGWRVPYRGSDCVVYHEGCGHTVGLPHPEPIDNSVMGVAQYEDWISRSFVNREQKIRLNWEPRDSLLTPQQELFSTFRAVPDPAVPQPGQPVVLRLDWPDDAIASSVTVRFQTALSSPWVGAPQTWQGPRPETVTLGQFDRPTPVSYRIDAILADGSTAELWGYLQVRNEPAEIVKPAMLSKDLMPSASDTPPLATPAAAGEVTDLLGQIDPGTAWAQGRWTLEDGRLTSPKEYGARIELPTATLTAYRMTVIVEPLDEPNGLILGHRIADQRFATLFSFPSDDQFLNAIENVDGQNVGNETTIARAVFRRNQLSQVIVDVTDRGVTMSVDGHTLVSWRGQPDRLSLSDYWKTPDDRALFLGAYDCRYRFHRITVQPVSTSTRE